MQYNASCLYSRAYEGVDTSGGGGGGLANTRLPSWDESKGMYVETTSFMEYTIHITVIQ